MLRQFAVMISCVICILGMHAFANESDPTTTKPSLLLANVYHEGIDVQQYLVSEKFDGVRAFWNGKQLFTRNGRVIHAPAWFTRAFPATAMDGELWLERGKFDALSSIVRKASPIDADWQSVTYLVFELPEAKDTFTMRAKQIVQIEKLAKSPYLKAVKQYRVKDTASLKQHLTKVVALGGEGLMLHLADAHYTTGRSDVLLKLKLQHDAEAVVLKHLPGKGKYTDKLGALLVETEDGLRFKLGTGFTDAQRADPPKIGSIVTYRYRDKTANGKPRFASFLRIKTE